MKCLNPACKNEAKTRGLCAGCYAAMNVAIRMGIITWDSLMSRGLATEARPLGRPKAISDAEVLARQKEKYPNGIKTRAEFVDAIGGSLAVLNKRQRGMFDKAFPESSQDGIVFTNEKKMLTQAEMDAIFGPYFERGINPTREQFLEAIGGDIDRLMPHHRAIFDQMYPLPTPEPRPESEPAMPLES